MADLRRTTDGPSPLSDEGYDESLLPDYERNFLTTQDLSAFANALSAPEHSPSTDDLYLASRNSGDVGSRKGSAAFGAGARSPSIHQAFDGEGLSTKSRESLFITAQNDWAPVNPTKPGHKNAGRSDRKRERKRRQRRSSDETREGYLYTLLSWPLLLVVGAWIAGLGVSYMFTRLYIWLYEHFVAWRGKRQNLRKKLYATAVYADWVKQAKELDHYLGNDSWKDIDEYAYYDHKTVRRVLDQMRRCRRKAEEEGQSGKQRPIEELKVLIEACVKNNFVGVENSRLYSQTYYGTKNLVQEFVDEVERGVAVLASTKLLGDEEKRRLFKRMHTNFGRTALCLSGGASFAYYHFGVIKALLDANLLPAVITGTSGGALIAALVATRTDEELKQLLVPALAGKINACSEPFTKWLPRWWKTGARFDSLDWAARCSWFTRGSMTFREAYERTGRILNGKNSPFLQLAI